MQETIQMAVCDMTQKQVEKEYGPITIVQGLMSAVKDPQIFSGQLVLMNAKTQNDDEHANSKIKNVLLNDLDLKDKQKRQEFREQSGWEKLGSIGVPIEQLDKIKKKM